MSLGAVAAIAVVTIATAAVPGADERPRLDASPSPSSLRSHVQPQPPASPRTVTPPSEPKPSSVRPGSPSVPAKRLDLRWSPVPNADYYNVILWRDGTRLRDYWPRQPRVVLQRRELVRLGERDASAVHWFVYPVTVETRRSLVGPVHASGAFTLPPQGDATR
jgi:hypothetical protein